MQTSTSQHRRNSGAGLGARRILSAHVLSPGKWDVDQVSEHSNSIYFGDTKHRQHVEHVVAPFSSQKKTATWRILESKTYIKTSPSALWEVSGLLSLGLQWGLLICQASIQQFLIMLLITWLAWGYTLVYTILIHMKITPFAGKPTWITSE